MFPKKSGLDLCCDLRGAGLNVPILMLTARIQVMHKWSGQEWARMFT
jgi:DNA-binding response OmpR family regulator